MQQEILSSQSAFAVPRTDAAMTARGRGRRCAAFVLLTLSAPISFWCPTAVSPLHAAERSENATAQYEQDAIEQPVPPPSPESESATPLPESPSESTPAPRSRAPSNLFSTLGRQLVARDTMVGYIDTAIPMDQLRFRYESGYGVNRPSRGEFFWPGKTSPASSLEPESSVDYNDFRLYYETAPSRAFSLFAELPMRLLNPEVNDNTGGLGDMNAGFKWAFHNTCDAVTTFQWRTYIPTGDADRGLGTDHVSLEPALLHYHRLSDRLVFEAELRDWISVGGTPDFQGNILRYGIGLGYTISQTCCSRITPVCEIVGWTVLDGAQNVPEPPGVLIIEDAAGDTIVNVKLGVRATVGRQRDLYVGYGHALTGDVWYEDVLRCELRYRF